MPQGKDLTWSLGIRQLTEASPVLNAYRTFAAAPHRMMFFGGAVGLNLAIAWWLILLAGRSGALSSLFVVAAPGLIHAWLLIFGAFPFFVLGFLMTALPRWVAAPPLSPRAYQSVGFVLYTGFLITLFSSSFSSAASITGMALTAIGLLMGLMSLFQALARADRSILPAGALVSGFLFLGWVGSLLTAFGAFLDHPGLWRAGLQLGVWGFLVPLVFLVAHRVLPVFAANAIPGYPIWRTSWGPPLAGLLCLAHGGLLIVGKEGWLLATALPLALIALYHWLMWRPWQTRSDPLLWTAFAALLWLPLASGLYAWEAAAHGFGLTTFLGQAPLHAATVGLLASMVLVMATRVSRGHSGRPLQMDRMELMAFLSLQLAALLRVVADIPMAGAHRSELLVAAATLWLVAFLPWGWRYGRIYWLPRADGAPG